MADVKFTGLPAATSVAATDIVPIVADPSGTPVSKQATVAKVIEAGLGSTATTAAAGNHTHTYAPADATYITTAASTGLSAEVAIPTLAASPDIPPAAPNTEDDEFGATTLDAKWTESTNAAAHDHSTTWPSMVYVRFSDNQYYRLTQAYAPAGAFSITAKFIIHPSGNYQFAGISAYDSDESNGMRVIFGHNTLTNTATRAELDSKETGSWSNRGNMDKIPNLGQIYIHLQRDGSNNWQAYASANGLSWIQLATNAYSKTITVHHFTVALDQNGNSLASRCGIDWVRRNWITL